MTKVDVEGTPLKVGDFVWAALGKYNLMRKYEITGETPKMIYLKPLYSTHTIGLHNCEAKVLKANN